MGYYPIFLEMAGRSCLVVGGGPVAERKVGGLLEVGACLTVVSPAVTPQIARHWLLATTRVASKLRIGSPRNNRSAGELSTD